MNHFNQKPQAVIAVGTGYVNLADANCPQPIAASREVPEQTERLDKALYFAQESLQELIARLETITRPNAPETACNGIAAQCGPSTQHGGQLYGFGSRAGNLGERIQDLLRRLEV